MSAEETTLQKALKMGKEEKQQLIEVIKKEAHNNEVLYWGCSQAVLSSLQKHLGLGSSESFKAVTALAGGVAQSREVCGGVLGSVVAIGLAYGRDKYKTAAMAQPEFVEAILRGKKLCELVKQHFGSYKCADIVAKVRGGDWEYPRFNTIERLENHARCGYVTGTIAALAAGVILEPRTIYEDEINTKINDLNDDLNRAQKQQELLGVNLDYLLY